MERHLWKKIRSQIIASQADWTDRVWDFQIYWSQPGLRFLKSELRHKNFNTNTGFEISIQQFYYISYMTVDMKEVAVYTVAAVQMTAVVHMAAVVKTYRYLC